MNDNARKWADELKNFEQTKGHLRDGDRFCCLGVACELFRRETGRGKWGGMGYFSVDEGSSRTSLPRAVQNWLGLTHRGGAFFGGSLIEMNDIGDTFEQVAEKARSEPEGLFV